MQVRIKDSKKAAKFRKLAEGQAKQAEKLENPGCADQNYTARRAAQADNMRKRAEGNRRLEKIMNGLADDHENGTIHPALKPFNNASDINEVLAPYYPFYWKPESYAEKDLLKRTADLPEAAQAHRYLKNNEVLYYPDLIARIKTLLSVAKQAGKADYWDKDIAARLRDYARSVKLNIDSEESRNAVKALFETYLNQTSESEKERAYQARLKELEVAAQQVQGNDLFPTPPAVVAKMLAIANIGDYERILEPSAGKGAIADAILSEYDCIVDLCETSYTLRELLVHKGHDLVGHDFMDYKPGPVYDCIVMNPPFSKCQDIDHVRHAFDLLKPGGRLVAIMSEGVFFRQGAKEKAFRELLDKVGHSEKLEPGELADKAQAQRSNVVGRIVTMHTS